MQFKKTLAASAVATSALAAYVPSEPWSTLTPAATLKGGLTDYSTAFGIAVVPITTGSLAATSSASQAQPTSTASKAKRDAISQIGDGQPQADTKTEKPSPKTTAPAVSQIGDGQIQATTTTLKPSPKTTAPAVSQIGDGQIQATTKTQAPAVSQIGDGQIQATTKTQAPAVSQIGDGQIQATTKTQAPAVSQIGDGQIQATTKTQAPAVSQIGDGQIQATTKTTAPAVSQIGDGQIQATTKATKTAASQVGDGQVQATTAKDKGAAETKAPTKDDPLTAQSCKNSGTLQMTLKDSVLTDGKGRLGSIVANRQFQFDGPPPQAGAIYAKGWSLSPEGNLALGDSDVFYQCLSGDFYNLYDQSVATHCKPVHLQAIELVDC